MKWSTVAILCVAPLALARKVERFADWRNWQREPHAADLAVRHAMEQHEARDTITIVESDAGDVVTEVIVLWVNGGGAATTTAINAPATTGTSAAATHSVTVGGDAGLVYSPDTIEANIGDTVVFTFEAQNHTVTQSSFTEPCIAIDGFSSGFVPNPNNSVSPPPQFAMQVLVSTPLWFYCRQAGHCGKGMVFSINPTANKTQAIFQQQAIALNGTVDAYSTSAAAAAAATATSAMSAWSSTWSSTWSSATAMAAAPSATIVTGTGSTNADGSCSCSCLCGVDSFPSMGQGLYSYGGMGGSIPAAA